MTSVVSCGTRFDILFPSKFIYSERTALGVFLQGARSIASCLNLKINTIVNSSLSASSVKLETEQRLERITRRSSIGLKMRAPIIHHHAAIVINITVLSPSCFIITRFSARDHSLHSANTIFRREHTSAAHFMDSIT